MIAAFRGGPCAVFGAIALETAHDINVPINIGVRARRHVVPGQPAATRAVAAGTPENRRPPRTSTATCWTDDLIISVGYNIAGRRFVLRELTRA